MYTILLVLLYRQTSHTMLDATYPNKTVTYTLCYVATLLEYLDPLGI